MYPNSKHNTGIRLDKLRKSAKISVKTAVLWAEIQPRDLQSTKQTYQAFGCDHFGMTMIQSEWSCHASRAPLDY